MARQSLFSTALAVLCILTSLINTHASLTNLPPSLGVRTLAANIGQTTDVKFLSPKLAFVSTRTVGVYLFKSSSDNSTFTFDSQSPLIDLRSELGGLLADRGVTSLAIAPNFLVDGTRGYIFVSYVYDPKPENQTMGTVEAIKFNRIKRYLLNWNSSKDTFDIEESKLVWGMCTQSKMKTFYWGDDCSVGFREGVD